MLFWNAKSPSFSCTSVTFTDCIFVTLPLGWYETLLTLKKKKLKRRHLSWTSVMFELKIDIIILIFFCDPVRSLAVWLRCALFFWLKSFNNRCFIHDDNWNTAVEPLSHLHYSFKVSVHNECDDAAQKAVYVLTLWTSQPCCLFLDSIYFVFVLLYYYFFFNLHNNVTRLVFWVNVEITQSGSSVIQNYTHVSLNESSKTVVGLQHYCHVCVCVYHERKASSLSVHT